MIEAVRSLVRRARTSRALSSRRERGAAALEFGFMLPLLAVVLFGTIEFGQAYYRQQVLTGAVREGARAGSAATVPKLSSTQISDKVKNYLESVGWDKTKASVSVTGAGGATGTSLTVQVTYPTSLRVTSKLVKLFKGSMTTDASGNINLTAKVVMEND